MMTKEEAVKAYDQLVQFRQQNQLYKTKENLGKIETHHILPTSCGGEDVPENRIDLLAKEHFMAHVYLWIIHHEDEFHYQTVCALNNMIKGTLKGFRKELREFILASEEYQKAREEFAKYNSETIGSKIFGENNGAFGKHWYHDPVTLSCAMFYEDSQPDGWLKGRKFIKETKRQKVHDKYVAKKQLYIQETQEMADYFTKYGYEATCKKFPRRFGKCTVNAMIMRFCRCRKKYGIRFESIKNGRKRQFLSPPDV